MSPDDHHILDPESFAAALAEQLVAEGIAQVEEREGLILRLRVGDTPVTTQLTRFYAAYLDAPHALPAIAQAFIEVVRRVGAEGLKEITYEQVQGRLFPMLKPQGYLEATGEQGLPALVHHPFLAGLVITYVIDLERSMAYVNTEHLARWPLSQDELHTQALANLQRHTTAETYIVYGQGARTLCVCQTNDGYDATRLLLPSLMAEWAQRVPGHLLLGIPNRDFLIGFSDRDPQVVANIAAQVRRDARTRDHGLTSRLFIWREGRVQEVRGREN